MPGSRLGFKALIRETGVVVLQVVAFGTSSPELAVSLQASLAGEPDIALGNVVGSNVFNFVIRQSVKESPAVRAEYETEFAQRSTRVSQRLLNIVLVIIGLAMLMLGSRWLVSGAVAIAEALGVSKLVIALTIIAAGTSLPEVATSVVASIRGERDIAVGNVVGSCLFNVLAIVGLSSVVAMDGIRVAPAALRIDLPVMIAVSIACLPICFTDYRIARWEGFLFLAYYAGYTLYLVLDSADHDALPEFSAIMGLFVIPLTLVTPVVLTVRAWLEERVRQWPSAWGGDLRGLLYDEGTYEERLSNASPQRAA
jgi:cation:H+ antiporter